MLWKFGAVAALAALALFDATTGVFKTPGLYPWVGWVALAAIVLPTYAWLRPNRVVAALAVLTSVTLTVINPWPETNWGLAETAALCGLLLATTHRARSWWDAPFIVGVTAALVTQPLQNGTGQIDVIMALILLVIAIGVIASVGYLRLSQRAKEQQIQAVKAEQKAEFARDLHDFVGHHITGMVVLAQGAHRIVERNPQMAADALKRIEEAGGEAMTAMRRMVGMLRDDAPVAPVAGIADLEPLVQSEPRATLALHGDLDTLPLEVASSVHRVVMESLTNIRKHATDATKVDINVRSGDDWVTVKVSNNGKPAKPGNGFGLIGLTERVQALGGRIKAGPGIDGGWVVDAALPTGKAVA